MPRAKKSSAVEAVPETVIPVAEPAVEAPTQEPSKRDEIGGRRIVSAEETDGKMRVTDDRGTVYLVDMQTWNGGGKIS